MKKAKLKSQSKPKSSQPLKFPAVLLVPVMQSFKTTLAKLEQRRKVIAREDPFLDTDRVNDNAATDVEADEQFGHARVSAIKGELDRKIVLVKKAMTRIRLGKYGLCEECNQMIDTDRLIVFPEATLCASCQKKKEK